MKCECGGIVTITDTNGDAETYECVDCGRTGIYTLSTNEKTGCLQSEWE